ncbi:hypothetical protein [Streptomyces sp. NPDC057877]|uniref:hypothetical protein n=1 Tax=Streptomyces sp. NPDC057877 TaxID=3346269 RepID=UPI0036B628E3
MPGQQTQCPRTELPYDEISHDDYAEAAARDFVPFPVLAGVTLLKGPCPRCGGTMSVHLVEDIVRGGRSGAVASGPYHTMRCGCRNAHPGQPEGREGCGAYWNIVVARADPS